MIVLWISQGWRDWSRMVDAIPAEFEFLKYQNLIQARQQIGPRLHSLAMEVLILRPCSYLFCVLMELGEDMQGVDMDKRIRGYCALNGEGGITSIPPHKPPELLSQ